MTKAPAVPSWMGYSNNIHKYACEHNVEDGPIELGSFRELHFLSNALVGEAGELANVVKKIGRDGRSEELLNKLRGEIADCFIYLHHICEAIGENRDFLVQQKTEELFTRWPEIKPVSTYHRRNVFTADGPQERWPAHMIGG